MTSSTGNLSLSNYSVLVSGAKGFLGQSLIPALKSVRADVYRLQRDFSPVAETIETGKSRVVVHLAGLSRIDRCEEDRAAAFDANLGLTYRALEYAKKIEADLFVYPSTGLVYGGNHEARVSEQSPLEPTNMYAVTKCAAESLVQAFGKAAGFATTIVRLGNVYGPGLAEESVIGTLAKCARAGEDLVVRDLTPIRDFIYIDDVAEGLIRLIVTAERDSSTVVNLASSQGSSIQQVAETMCDLKGMSYDRIVGNTKRGDGFSQLILDNAHLRSLTGWQPQYDLKQGLLKMLDS